MLQNLCVENGRIIEILYENSNGYDYAMQNAGNDTTEEDLSGQKDNNITEAQAIQIV